MILCYSQHITKRYESSSSSVGFVSQYINHDRCSRRWIILVWPMKRLFSSNCRFSINDRAWIGGSKKHAKSKNRLKFTFQPSNVLSRTITRAEMVTFLAVTLNVQQTTESSNSCYLPVNAETDFKRWRMHGTYIVRGTGMANLIRTRFLYCCICAGEQRQLFTIRIMGKPPC